MEWFYQSDKCWGAELNKTLSEALEYPAIVHFAGTPPWFKEFDHHFYYDEWMRYNRLLRHPVKRSYQTKGWPLVKHIVWKLFHHHRL